MCRCFGPRGRGAVWTGLAVRLAASSGRPVRLFFTLSVRRSQLACGARHVLVSGSERVRDSLRHGNCPSFKRVARELPAKLICPRRCSMVAGTHQEIHSQHREWLKDIAMWHDDLDLGRNEYHTALTDVA